MAETELLPCPKPCPFCDDVIHLRLSTAGRGQSYMNCDVCGADGPLGDTPDLAIAAWNRRSLPLPDPAEGSSGAGAPPFDPVAKAIDVACVALDDWANDLAITREQYIDAHSSGRFNGRRIDPKMARALAHDFGERSSAVADCPKIIRAALKQAAKAKTNKQFADMCDAALSSHRGRK